MHQESWIQKLGRSRLLSPGQFVAARTRQLTGGISIEEALVEVGVSIEDINAAKAVSGDSVFQSDKNPQEMPQPVENRLTKAVWETLQNDSHLREIAPSWVRKKLRLSYEETMALPTLEDISRRADSNANKIGERPYAYLGVETQDSLGILRSKLRNEHLPSGWRKIFTERLTMLSPYVNQEILTVTFAEDGNCFLLELTWPELKYIHAEEVDRNLMKVAVERVMH